MLSGLRPPWPQWKSRAGASSENRKAAGGGRTSSVRAGRARQPNSVERMARAPQPAVGLREGIERLGIAGRQRQRRFQLARGGRPVAPFQVEATQLPGSARPERLLGAGAAQQWLDGGERGGARVAVQEDFGE